MVAIMGPSGSGKSTLLTMLGGKKTMAYDGEYFINGRPRDLKIMPRITAYVPQADILEVCVCGWVGVRLCVRFSVCVRVFACNSLLLDLSPLIRMRSTHTRAHANAPTHARHAHNTHLHPHPHPHPHMHTHIRTTHTHAHTQSLNHSLITHSLSLHLLQSRLAVRECFRFYIALKTRLEGEGIDQRVDWLASSLQHIHTHTHIHTHSHTHALTHIQHLQSRLTVRECFRFYIALKTRLEAEGIDQRVDWLASNLQLDNVMDSFIGDNTVRGISGGQKRRVTMGVWARNPLSLSLCLCIVSHSVCVCVCVCLCVYV